MVQIRRSQIKGGGVTPLTRLALAVSACALVLAIFL